MECVSCEKHINFVNLNWLAIRCVYCKRVFCEPCAILHFEHELLPDAYDGPSGYHKIELVTGKGDMQTTTTAWVKDGPSVWVEAIPPTPGEVIRQ